MRHLHVAAALLLGCSAKTYSFEDTEGRKASWACRNKNCDLQDRITSSNATPAPAGSPVRASDTAELIVPYEAENRYVTLCDAWVTRTDNSATAGSNGDLCRIITCKADADCPPLVSTPGVKCLNGLCGDGSRQLTQTDYMHLCLAGTGVWTGSPAQIARKQIADRASRPTLQPVPAECRQP